jgi:beta-lactamase regulating signal transducer with metallopeptidase domain
MNDVLHAILGPHPAMTLVAAVLQANLAASAAVLGVIAVRLPARRMFGPALAYHLWAAPPAVGLAALALFFVRPGPDPLTASLAAYAGPIQVALALWLAGTAALAAVFGLAQARFEAGLKAGRGGPAVVGLISPRIVMPPDDGAYNPQERELIRAHERAHVARKDPRAVAMAALGQCLFWFNPFAHLAARMLRLDQELACDATVMLSRPGARGLYARTLLKTQLAAQPLPLGCYWPARGRHPLEVRIALLTERRGPGGLAGGGGSVVRAANDAIRP